MIELGTVAVVPAAAVGLMLAIATTTDIRSRRVPLWLTAGSMLGGLAASVTAGHPSLAASLLGFAVGAMPLMPFVVVGGLGAGDVLVLGAIGVWQGWRFVLRTIWWMAIAGAGIALCFRHGGQSSVPYVPAIALGALVTTVISLAANSLT